MAFYKYTSISTASLVLKNKSLRWSSPILFNDLEECQFVPFTKDQYLEAYKNYIKILTEYAKGSELNYDFQNFSEINHMIIQLMRMLINRGTFSTEGYEELMLNIIPQNPETDYRDFINNAYISCFRVLCVTENLDNPLMWAHYADQNCGCVIEFENLYKYKHRFLREGYVRYHENLKPKLKLLDILLYGESAEIKDLIIGDIAFSKRTSWSYEKEYRLMFHENFGQIITKFNIQPKEKKITVRNQPDKLFTDVAIPVDSVRSVIFGARTSVEDMNEIKTIISTNNYKCTLYKMVLSEGQLKKKELE